MSKWVKVAIIHKQFNVFKWSKIWFFTIKLCIKSIFKINLGDEVIYNGERYFVINGIIMGKWTLSRKEPHAHFNVDRSKVKKVKSIKNWRHSFESTWRFYSINWFAIWYQDLNKTRGY